MKRQALLLASLVLAASGALLAPVVAARQPPPPTGGESANDLPAPDAASQRLARLVAARDPAAVPLLEEHFARSGDRVDKQQLALLLIDFGVRDPYVEFLLAEAEKAIDADMPFPLAVDDAGEFVKQSTTEEFLAWARAHGVDPGAAAWLAVYGYPADVGFLARAGDERAAPLLRRGLLAPNPLVAYQAARGLARLSDARSVEAVVRRMERGPRAVSTLMAHALVYFDDPRARAATESFFTDARLLGQMREEAARERAQRAAPPGGAPPAGGR